MSTPTPPPNADWSRFCANGTSMVLSAAAFRVAPSYVTGAALAASVGNFYASSQAPAVRTAFGTQYDRVNQAASGVHDDMLRSPRNFWNPGRSGI